MCKTLTLKATPKQKIWVERLADECYVPFEVSWRQINTNLILVDYEPLDKNGWYCEIILEFVDDNTRNDFRELINKYQKILNHLETCYNMEVEEIED